MRTWKDRGGTECGLLNQLEVTENCHEPGSTLSTTEQTNTEQTLNVLKNCVLCSLTGSP